MSLIDKTYFQGEINLPGLQSPDIQAKLAIFITKYELQYLQQALGYSFWKLFNDSLPTPPANGRFDKLLNGGEYTDCRGFVKKWNGLVSATKDSSIANYVYYWYTRDNASFTTTVGEVKATTENSTNGSMVMKQTRAYNAMVALTDQMHEFLKYSVNGDATPMFPEFDECQTTYFERLRFTAI